MRRSPYARLAASIAALGGALAAAAVAVALLHTTLTGASGSPPTVPAAPPPTHRAAAPPHAPHGFPAPPDGAVVFSREEGADLVALGIVPGSRRALLQVSIVDGQGSGATGRSVRVSLGGRPRPTHPCGPGCYRRTVRVPPHPRLAIVVTGRGTAAATWRIALPEQWPPTPAGTLVRDAGAAWRRLRSLAYRDRLASDATHAITSTWRVEAPDRATYALPDGSAGIVIGRKRWDRPSARARWTTSQSLPIRQPAPFWAAVADAHLLRRATLGGRTVEIVSFFDPVTPAWFRVAIQPGTLHTLDLSMDATAHFMHDTYFSFDAAPPIVPPDG
jgi:hypothetical protein